MTKKWIKQRVTVVSLTSLVVTAILVHDGIRGGAAGGVLFSISSIDKVKRNTRVKNKKEYSPCICRKLPPTNGEEIGQSVEEHQSDTSRITKQIVQTFKLPFEKLPAKMKNATLSWIDLNPEYEYIYMDDNEQLEYVLTHGSHSFIEVYNASRSGAMRCDLFRALLIYREGGVYADIDTTIQKPLSEILNQTDDLVSGLGGRGDLHQWFLAYAPCHPVLKKLLQNIATYDASKLYEMKTEEVAGPMALHMAATETLGEPVSFKFQPGTYKVKDAAGCRRNGTYSIRVLEGDLLDGNVDFKYDGYTDDLKKSLVTYWMYTGRQRR